MRYVVAFDVGDDKRRYRVVKALLGVGRRVQESVFELDELGEGMLKRVLAEVQRAMDPSVDAVRVYALCGACTGKVEAFGVQVARPSRRVEDFVVF